MRALFILLLIIPLTAYSAQNFHSQDTTKQQRTELTNKEYDSLVRLALQREVSFALKHIDSSYICGRRGIDSAQWNSAEKLIRSKVRDVKNLNGWEYSYALRYFGLLLSDGHMTFPDGGVYSRFKRFQPTDTLLPLWVKTWRDGRVFNVKDYTGKIPQNAQIISVNGWDAQEVALLNRKIYNSEELRAMAYMNLSDEADPLLWQNFRNFFFMEGVKAPYFVEYIAAGSQSVDTVTLEGLTRKESERLYINSGDRRKVREVQKRGEKAIEFQKIDDNIGLLTINSFWGGSFVELILFTNDLTFKGQLKSAMRKLKRSGVQNLIIDLRSNHGGMEKNVYHTMSYLSDQPFEAASIIRVTDRNREIAAMVSSNGLEALDVEKEKIHRLKVLIDSVPSGTLLPTDSLFSLSLPAKDMGYRYSGKIYLLTSNLTYSAAQEFAQFMKLSDRAVTAGEPCGGYYSISSGNGDFYPPPFCSQWMPLVIPRGVIKAFYGENGIYDYMEVDIPLEVSFEDWLYGKDRSLDSLVKAIADGQHR